MKHTRDATLHTTCWWRPRDTIAIPEGAHLIDDVGVILDVEGPRVSCREKSQVSHCTLPLDGKSTIIRCLGILLWEGAHSSDGLR